MPRRRLKTQLSSSAKGVNQLEGEIQEKLYIRPEPFSAEFFLQIINSELVKTLGVPFLSAYMTALVVDLYLATPAELSGGVRLTAMAIGGAAAAVLTYGFFTPKLGYTKNDSMEEQSALHTRPVID